MKFSFPSLTLVSPEIYPQGTLPQNNYYLLFAYVGFFVHVGLGHHGSSVGVQVLASVELKFELRAQIFAISFLYNSDCRILPLPAVELVLRKRSYS